MLVLTASPLSGAGLRLMPLDLSHYGDWRGCPYFPEIEIKVDARAVMVRLSPRNAELATRVRSSGGFPVGTFCPLTDSPIVVGGYVLIEWSRDGLHHRVFVGKADAHDKAEVGNFVLEWEKAGHEPVEA